MKKSVKKNLKIKGVAMQFLPYSEIKNLGSTERLKKILDIILGNNILVLQGRLKPQEETRLIEDTMVMAGHLGGFRGIELAVISNDTAGGFFSKMKQGMANMLAGGELGAITIIGPASIVKEIKKDPKKIEVLLNG